MIDQEQNSIRPRPTHPSSSGGGEKGEKNWPFILSIVGLILLVAGIVAFLLVSKNKFSDGMPWILIAIAVLIVLTGVAAIIIAKTRRGKHEPDYRTFFIMGIMWIPLGIALDNPVFWIMGLMFMIIGLANKNKWKKQKPWSELPSQEKKIKGVIIVALGVLVLLGLVAFFLAQK